MAHPSFPLVRSVAKFGAASALALLLAACGGSGDGSAGVGGGGGGDGGGSGGSGGSAPPSAAFIELGTLAGYEISKATAVSADGSTVVGTAQTLAGEMQAFRWTLLGGMQGLGVMPGARRSAANDVSANGSVVVGSGDTLGPRPTSSMGFRWTAAGGMQQMPAIGLVCSASAVSDDGDTVVGTCLSSGNFAFRWRPGIGSDRLPQYGGGTSAASVAMGIAGDGEAFTGSGNPFLTGALLWHPDLSVTTLGKLRASDLSATGRALSRNGTVVTGWSVDNAGVAWPFRWTELDGMTPLSLVPLGTDGGFSAAISDDGARVVGWFSDVGADSAFVWEPGHGLRSLAELLLQDYGLVVPGWQLERATGISGDGRVLTGYGRDPSGATRGWLLRLGN